MTSEIDGICFTILVGKETGDAELKDGGQVCNGNGVVLMSNGRHVKPDSCRYERSLSR